MIALSRFICAVYSLRSDVWIVENFDASEDDRKAANGHNCGDASRHTGRSNVMIPAARLGAAVRPAPVHAAQ